MDELRVTDPTYNLILSKKDGGGFTTIRLTKHEIDEMLEFGFCFGGGRIVQTPITDSNSHLIISREEYDGLVKNNKPKKDKKYIKALESIVLNPKVAPHVSGAIADALPTFKNTIVPKRVPTKLVKGKLVISPHIIQSDIDALSPRAKRRNPKYQKLSGKLTKAGLEKWRNGRGL